MKQKIRILSIEKRTKEEDKELLRLRWKDKLTAKEKSRKFFLEVKDLWNCEC